jgi:mRNA-degrading endonuclease RelE of RelBE toxin-antitoxin system
VEYAIRLAEWAEEHLEDLSAREQAIILDAIAAQLRYEPARETRNRKPLRPNPVAPWELRIGPLRVFYEVEAKVVTVLAIGIKRGNQLFIAGEEIQL